MGMKRPKTYSIGAMARLCGISPRQLRYYDQIGLIKPKYRNPETGYRYYTEDQIELLFFLNELRNIGISNESIPRLFINRDVEQLVQELQLNLAMVEQEIQASLNRYHSIVNALVMNTRTLAYLTGQEAIDSSRYQHFWISVNWVLGLIAVCRAGLLLEQALYPLPFRPFYDHRKESLMTIPVGFVYMLGLTVVVFSAVVVQHAGVRFFHQDVFHTGICP